MPQHGINFSLYDIVSTMKNKEGKMTKKVATHYQVKTGKSWFKPKNTDGFKEVTQLEDDNVIYC